MKAPAPWLRKRWWALGLPAAGMVGLMAIAPPLPGVHPPAGGGALSAAYDGPFRYAPTPEAYALDLDPRQVRLDLFDGWDREREAYADTSALAFVSGPMYERYVEADGSEITVPLGDIKLGERIWRGRNRTAARQRAYLGIRHNGQVDFGYGELTPGRATTYETFIGGLHSIYNDLENPPAEYRGAYSISMGQQIRYFLPRIRVIYGLRSDGRVEVLMSRDGLTLEQTRALARQHGFRAAYMPDHASKSRFIVPGRKDFSEDDANWISGGATSFVHVPYMLRLSRRPLPLQGSLLAGLTPRLPRAGCGGPLQCGRSLGGQLLDRTLAGFNRLMEEGVEPVARLLWAPQVPKIAGRSTSEAPLREPVITADPRSVTLRQEQDLRTRRSETSSPADPPPPPVLPDAAVLPPPERMPDPASGTTAPPAGKEASTAAEEGGSSVPADTPPSAEGAGGGAETPTAVSPSAVSPRQAPGAAPQARLSTPPPPPPVLPPPPPMPPPPP